MTSYHQSAIVSRAISCTIFATVDADKYDNLEISGWGSVKIAPFDKSHTSSHWYFTVTMAMSWLIRETHKHTIILCSWNLDYRSSHSGTLKMDQLINFRSVSHSKHSCHSNLRMTCTLQLEAIFLLLIVRLYLQSPLHSKLQKKLYKVRECVTVT